VNRRDRLQEIAHGGLGKSTRRKLQTMAKALRATGRVGPAPSLSLKPGARLVREWRGRTNTVTVMEDGFEYAGSPKRFELLTPRFVVLVLIGTQRVEWPESGWTSSRTRALLGVRRRAAKPPFSAPRSPLGHRGVVLVTADAVAGTGEEHGEAHRYPADRVVEGRPARGRSRGCPRPNEQDRRRKGRSKPGGPVCPPSLSPVHHRWLSLLYAAVMKWMCWGTHPVSVEQG
jgi:hypothetical protein